MNEAIKLAIEKGGYEMLANQKAIVEIHFRKFGKNTARRIFETFILQDPVFWQTLGKALGWGECNEGYHVHTCNVRDSWKENAHQYFDLLLTGGDTEKFWKDLINEVATEPN